MIPNILWKKNEKIYKNGYYECKCKCECDWIVYIFIPNKNPFHIYNISDPISGSPASPSTAQPQSLTPPAPATAQLSQARQTPPAPATAHPNKAHPTCNSTAQSGKTGATCTCSNTALQGWPPATALPPDSECAIFDCVIAPLRRLEFGLNGDLIARNAMTFWSIGLGKSAHY